MRAFQVGDRVIYQKQKQSTHPGPRAENVRPSRFGDEYTYTVDKFWTVTRIMDGGQLEITTRTGKTHLLQGSDPHLRRPSWWERIVYAGRFPAAAASAS